MPTEISNPADTDDAEMIQVPERLSPESIDGLLAQAAEAQSQGDLDRAEPVYRAIIAAEKRNADAHNLLGTLLAQRGDLEDAVKSIRRAVSITPSFPEAFFNLGIVHRRRGDLDSAIAAYRRATGLREEYADAWNNLGNALADAGRMEEAALSYRRAIAARPGFPEAYGNLAGALVSLGEVDDAISTLRKSLTINPDQIDAILTLGDLQRRTGRYDHAADSFRHILKRSPALVIAHVALIEVSREKARSEAGETDKPDLSAALDAAEKLISTHDDIPDGYFHRAIIHAEVNDAAAAQTDLETCLRLDPTDRMGASLSLSILLEQPAPAIAPHGYVETLFDTHAEHFDTWLADALSYTVPTSMARDLADPANGFGGGVVCDLGCGTGLCVVALKKALAGQEKRTVTQAIGVDLSGRMLAKAHAREVYDHLHQQDVSGFLNQYTESFDALLAGDLFIYIGEMADILRQAQRALKPEGLFSFSIESTPQGQLDPRAKGFVLTQSRRYAHSSQSVRDIAGESGFEVVSERDEVLRQEAGEPVAGTIFLLRRT